MGALQPLRLIIAARSKDSLVSSFYVESRSGLERECGIAIWSFQELVLAKQEFDSPVKAATASETRWLGSRE